MIYNDLVDGSKRNFFIQVLSLATLVFILVIFLLNIPKPQEAILTQAFVPTPTPTPFNPFPYKPPNIAYARAYKIMLVGDSIVGSLGLNAQPLRQHLIELYPNHEFVNYNYGFGATSIETLPGRLASETEYEGQKYQSILSQGFDLIIIESFAYNPLSQMVEDEGIARHIEILDESIRQIIKAKPDSIVAIMTPIAPSKSQFAKGVYDLSPEERVKWAKERISYINSVISYARDKNIPLINVYEKSLTPQGEANLEYINKDDYIHPSDGGVDIMGKTIAEFVYTNSLFPE